MILQVIITVFAAYGMLILLRQIWNFIRLKYKTRPSRIMPIAQKIAFHALYIDHINSKLYKNLDKEKKEKCESFALAAIALKDLFNVDLNDVIIKAGESLKRSEENVEH
jgi:hypothetical protein